MVVVTQPSQVDAVKVAQELGQLDARKVALRRSGLDGDVDRVAVDSVDEHGELTRRALPGPPKVDARYEVAHLLGELLAATRNREERQVPKFLARFVRLHQVWQPPCDIVVWAYSVRVVLPGFLVGVLDVFVVVSVKTIGTSRKVVLKGVGLRNVRIAFNNW